MSEYEISDTRVALGKRGMTGILHCVELYKQAYGEDVSPAKVINNAVALLTVRLEQELEEGEDGD